MDFSDPLISNYTIESRFRNQKHLKLPPKVINLLEIHTASQVVSDSETIPDSKDDEDALESQSKYEDD